MYQGNPFFEAVAGGQLAVALPVALLAGLISFLSPCVLPLVPGFLGYVTGLGDVALAERAKSRMILGALLFVAGFSAVFIATTAFLASIGAALVEHRTLLMRVGGVLVILMALVFLGAGSTHPEAVTHTVDSWLKVTGPTALAVAEATVAKLSGVVPKETSS